MRILLTTKELNTINNFNDYFRQLENIYKISTIILYDDSNKLIGYIRDIDSLANILIKPSNNNIFNLIYYNNYYFFSKMIIKLGGKDNDNSKENII